MSIVDRRPVVIRSIATLALTVAFLAGLASSGQAQKAKKINASDTYSIREKCIAKAQQAYPDNGLGQTSQMNQRQGIYMSCARSNGIRP
jgi:nitrate/TMAO reductase-like tetraheme cytochrome c subunit